MGFTAWLGLGMKKNKDVKVKKIKESSVDMGAMAAGSPSVAAGALKRSMAGKNVPTKVLMVQDGDYLEQVTQYALKMALRLDCEIIALDVTEKPLQFSGERRVRESERFVEMAEKNATLFCDQARTQGVKVEHVMDIGEPEEIIAKVSNADAGIRYVLSKPEGKISRKDRPFIPVFDVRCSRLHQ